MMMPILITLAAWTPMRDRVAAARIAPKDHYAIELMKESGDHKMVRTSDPVVEVEPSPNGQYVGALVSEKSASGELPSMILHIWEREGRPLFTIKGAQKFAFSPNGRRLAVIIGPSYEGALGFKPERVEIIHLPTCRRRVAGGLETARDIAWIRHRNPRAQLFAEVVGEGGQPEIVRYNPRTNRAEPTKLLGLQCSPDGEYYFLTARETEQAGLCKRGDSDDRCVRAFTWSNRPVPLPKKLRLNRRLVWADEGHEVVFADSFGKERSAVLLDIATGVSRRLEGRVDWSWKPRLGRLIIRDKLRDHKLVKAIKKMKLRRMQLPMRSIDAPPRDRPRIFKLLNSDKPREP